MLAYCFLRSFNDRMYRFGTGRLVWLIFTDTYVSTGIARIVQWLILPIDTFPLVLLGVVVNFTDTYVSTGIAWSSVGLLVRPKG